MTGLLLSDQTETKRKIALGKLRRAIGRIILTSLQDLMNSLVELGLA
jgi:hypothetical protein